LREVWLTPVTAVNRRLLRRHASGFAERPAAQHPKHCLIRGKWPLATLPRHQARAPHRPGDALIEPDHREGRETREPRDDIRWNEKFSASDKTVYTAIRWFRFRGNTTIHMVNPLL